MDNFIKIVNEMKALGEQLVDHSFPKQSGDVEDDISPLKTREVTIDGYEVTIYYSKAEYPTHFMETFQIFGQRVPFLPFNLVVKVGRIFLGNEHLSMVDVYVDNKKLYIWTRTTDKDGRVKPTLDESATESEYEGFHFHRLNPAQVNFL